MKSIASMLRGFNDDESGAAFIEYTALLGVILVVGIVLLTAVGNWANNRWTKLNSQLTAAP
jgi:Flp pilus assembly pilin Flp